MLVIGGTGTVKTTVIKSIRGAHDSGKILQVGTTLTAAFVVGVTAWHSILYLSVKKSFR